MLNFNSLLILVFVKHWNSEPNAALTQRKKRQKTNVFCLKNRTRPIEITTVS